ncbi:SigB/SigF/SigG family RNA polymerase sigma factor [Streptomyces pristinaespiralis]|jgi:RNA polymerase sigma-B factor|uniref:SigB/SigF/SigG family RNA polymerase sigma factor n=1 Tax=Streptomyces pristinaespiralis TaxID=38300 RepID=UPI0037B4CFB1
MATAAPIQEQLTERGEGESPLEGSGGTVLPRVDEASEVAPADARRLSALFFDRLQHLEEGTPEYQYARNTLIEMNISLVRYVARRFRNRAESDEDIVQVGTIGLIKAIDRFDLSREVEFATFAVPYILGEIKRFFRDTSWAVHVPRRLQELRLELVQAVNELSGKLHRAPTAAELSEHLQLPVEEVTEGLVAMNGYVASSFDVPNTEGGPNAEAPFAERFGDLDPALGLVEDLQALKPLIEELDDRDRLILRLRFGDELKQAEIGERLGISQMQVSRLLTRTLTRLRQKMLT